MKKISVIMIAGFMLSLLNARVFAQNKPELNTTIIEPYRLPITFHKTTNLVFPYAIKSVDRGSKDILAQKAKGVDNVLQIKAGKLGFEQTNLTVITADGKLYSYLLDYSDTPTVLNISFASNTETKSETIFPSPIVNEAEMQAEAEMVINEERNIHGIKDKSFGIKLLMDGLFINDERQGQGEQQTTKQNAKNENKQGDADDSDAGPKASNKRRKKQSNSIS